MEQALELPGVKLGINLSIMAWAICAAVPALAQSAATQDKFQTPATDQAPAEASGKARESGRDTARVHRMDSVNVTAQRSQTQTAVATKRNDNRVMDVLTSEQIKNLPDTTVNDAVKRVAGVSTSFNADTVNGRDDAVFVTIRGLDAAYNNVTIDGAPWASTDQTSRGARTNVLSATMVKKLEVYKTWQPDQDPNAVGGSINITTRSAFDNGGKPFFQVSGGLGNADGTGKVLSGADGLARKINTVFSTTFGPTKALGLVIAANYEKENTVSVGHMTTDQVFYSYYNPDGKIANPSSTGGPNPGNGIPVPQQNKNWLYYKNFERIGGNIKLEAKFSPDVYGFVGVDFNDDNVHAIRNEVIIDTSRSTGPNPVVNQTPTSGHFNLGEAEAGNMLSQIDRSTKTVRGGLDWKLGNNRELSFRSSFSQAADRNPQRLAKYVYGDLKYAPGAYPTITGVPELAMDYNTSDFNPSFNLANPGNFTNLNNWKPFYWRIDNVRIDDRVGNLKLDYRQNVGIDARGPGYAVGADYRSLGHSYNKYYNMYTPTAAGNLTLADAGNLSGVPLPYSGGLPFVIVNDSAAWNQLAQNGSLATAYSANLANSLQNNYSHNEQAASVYGLATYQTDRIAAMFGLRQDYTNLRTTGNVRNTANGTTSWQSVTRRSHYDYLLPAASLVLSPLDNVKLKLAYSETIGRPNFDAYAPNSSISENSDGSITVKQGNPNIKPRKSNNFDFSTEWYLPHNGLASVALFRKKISNEIYTLSGTGQFSYGGALRPAFITQPLNSSASQINGIEMSLVQGTLGWLSPYLSGFGFSVNETFMAGRLNAAQSNGSTRTIKGLINQPDNITNVSLFYKYRKFGVTLAYNRLGESLRQIDSAYAYQDVYWKARDQWDLQASYDAGRGWRTHFAVANLTGSPIVSVTGKDRNLLKDSFSAGRVFWLGLTYAPKLN
ncbi:MAG: TonB-dependent receptor [Paraburkholderia sp.]|uniref:TonB-dependent receptor n=1 Tax=Paraburkholderia sp. TaxID=1926495 RepID=UPI001213EB84|nr:TonB-dependent receptor [Paraburkholderia sp.]TAM05316.1 MAG: TonB-dependent receptor [Paraburkholderia sp.]